MKSAAALMPACVVLAAILSSNAHAIGGCPQPGTTPQPPCKNNPGAFAHATCVTSPAFEAPFPVAIGAIEFDPKAENPPGGATDGIDYALNTQSSWRLLVNPNVQVIQPYYGAFQTESGYDYLQIDHAGTTLKYTGNLNAGPAPVQAGSTWTTHYAFGLNRDVEVTWHSDYSVANFVGPQLSQVAVQCKSGQATAPLGTTTLVVNTRNDGLLIKSGDVIFLAAYQPANKPMLVLLNGKAGTAGADFDVYASTTVPFPDGTNYQWRGFGFTSNESLDIPTSASGRWVYLAVHAFHGAGHFSIHALVQDPAERFSNLTVCPVNVTLTDAQKTSLASFLKSGATRLLAMTNGNVWADGFDVTAMKTTCEASCSICLLDSGSTSWGGGGTSPQGFGQIKMGLNNWSKGASGGWLFAHEAGHSHLGLPDEYSGPPAGNSTPMACGHTIMANHAYARFLCSMAHCKDGHVTDSTVCLTSDPSGFEKFDANGHRFYGPDFSAQGEVMDPTDYFGIPSLLSRVSVSF
jgi:hypothetical protein